MCLSCSKKSAFVNLTPPVVIPQVCTKTLIEYQDILVKVETQLQSHPNFNIFLSTIKSQVGVYNQNCSLFQDYIDTSIVPLLI